ncbi:MAG: hypothetical protein K1T65_03970 [Candidatus Aramenus sp.]|nr:hypothetical protein [Candidatus Aramenus sp.]
MIVIKMQWIKEMSFTFKCNLNSITFRCNTGSNILELEWRDNKLNVSLFSPTHRVNYSSGRLFDMHNLSVKRGKEAEDFLREVFAQLSKEIQEGAEELKSAYDLPVAIIKEFARDMCNFEFRPSKFFDIGIKELEIELNKEFLKDRPGLYSERKLKLLIRKQDDVCLKVVFWLESRRKETLYSPDCVNYQHVTSEDISDSLRSLNEYVTEIRNFVINS